MSTTGFPRVIFPEEFDERAKFETPLKGWLSVHVELEDGSRYPVYFSDPVRLQQDLAEDVKIGRPCLAEPALVVLPKVTIEAIEAAVPFLMRQRFFDYLKPERTSHD